MSTAPMREALVGFIERQPHVSVALGTVIHAVGGLTTVSGVDLERFRRMSGGFRYVAGGPPRQPDDLIVDRYYAQQNNLRPGSAVNLLNRKWRVSGIFEQGQLARIVLPIRVLQDLTSTNGQVNQIFVKVDNPTNTRAVINELKAQLGDYNIYSMDEFLSMFSVDKVPGLSEFIAVIIGLSIVIGFLVVFLSMYTSVLERTREIGILKALGGTPVFVLGILLRETTLLALFGSLVGIGFSYVSRWLIMTIVPSSLSQYIVPEWWPIAGGIALLGALLGAAYPGWRAARQDPIEALSYE
jgi:putative ABC transport system permease protein